MSQYWDSLADRSQGLYTPEDLEAAAYRLVTEQVLYHSDRHSRVAYGIIERFEREYRQALSPMGLQVEVNRQRRYVYAIPQHAKAGTASTQETLLALVLRGIYDEYARQGQFTDDGEVICDIIDLAEKYRLTTGRELPGKMEFASLMRTLRRWGIAKRTDDGHELLADNNSGQFAIVIRPAIVEILGETAMMRLARWQEPNVDHEATQEPESEMNHEAS